MISNIDHIAIAVHDLQSALERFRVLTGATQEQIRIEDLEAETARTAHAGLSPISPPSAGAGKKKIVFFNPKETGKVLIEFVQKL